MSANDLAKSQLDDDTKKQLKAYLRPNLLPQYTQEGSLLFTHQGLSGPAALKLSSFGAKLMHALDYDFNISVNFLPDLPVAMIANMLLVEASIHPKR